MGTGVFGHYSRQWFFCKSFSSYFWLSWYYVHNIHDNRNIFCINKVKFECLKKYFFHIWWYSGTLLSGHKKSGYWMSGYRSMSGFSKYPDIKESGYQKSEYQVSGYQSIDSISGLKKVWISRYPDIKTFGYFFMLFDL